MPRGARPFFAPDQDTEVARRYLDGETPKAIGQSYGVSERPVVAALSRMGVERRHSRSDYGWQETQENIAELVRLWHDGLGVQQIARQVKTGNDRVSRLLREAGVNPRFGGQNHRFKGNQIDTLAAEYQAGASLNELAGKHGGTAVVIRNTLRRHGVQLRDKGSHQYWTPERIAWLKMQYLSGRSDGDIAAELGFSQPAISKRLRSLGLAAAQLRPVGAAHPSWKGGRTMRGGYAFVKISDDDPMALMRGASGYVAEHRLIMARKLNRPLLPGERPHHKNTIRADNSPGNLELWLTSQPPGGRVTDLLEHALSLLDTYMPQALVPGWQDLPLPEEIS